VKAFGLFVVIVATGCEEGAATPAPPAPVGSVGIANLSQMPPQTMYLTFCAPCHAKDARGYAADHAPSLINPAFLEAANDYYLRRSIAMGRPGTSMAPYSKAVGGPLDDSSIDRLVAYLRGQGPAAKPLPAAGRGDVTRGEPLYQTWCRSCHGDGKTRGEAPHLANPQFLVVATDAFIHQAMVTGRPGTKMEPFTDKLSPQDMDDIVAFVRDPTGKAPPKLETLPPPTGKEPLVINPKGKDPTFTLTAEPPSNEQKFVSAAQVERALAAKQKMIIIDARPQSDWMRVHIPGAVSIPHHDLKRLSEVPDDVWAIAYCACPHHLSGIVVDELRKRGHKKAVILNEGILEWHRRGYPIVAAPGVTAPPKEPVMAPGTIQ
jgi:mono/diheme cytochrome c family protein/rhodanese-related sulfurtransferase